MGLIDDQKKELIKNMSELHELANSYKALVPDNILFIGGSLYPVNEDERQFYYNIEATLKSIFVSEEIQGYDKQWKNFVTTVNASNIRNALTKNYNEWNDMVRFRTGAPGLDAFPQIILNNHCDCLASLCSKIDTIKESIAHYFNLLADEKVPASAELLEKLAAKINMDQERLMDQLSIVRENTTVNKFNEGLAKTADVLGAGAGIKDVVMFMVKFLGL